MGIQTVATIVVIWLRYKLRRLEKHKKNSTKKQNRIDVKQNMFKVIKEKKRRTGIYRLWGRSGKVGVKKQEV